MHEDELRSSKGREERRRSRDRDRDRDRGYDRSRDRHRLRDNSSRDKSRDYRRDDHRDERYRMDRYRNDKDRGRYHNPHERERSHKSSRRDRSRSKSRDSRRRRSRSRSRDRKHRRVRDRSQRDLSVEIEQELQHLRKLSDMKQAAEVELELKNQKETESESQTSNAAETSRNQSSSHVSREKQKNDLNKIFNSNSKTDYVPEIQTEEERIEFQKKMQEKLQAHLAAEGKLYPRPKPSPAINSITGFANDGSFLEMFKKMQEQAQLASGLAMPAAVDDNSALQYYAGSTAQTIYPAITTTVQQQQQHPVPISIVGRRRGGKILKTGIVKKPKPIEESFSETPNDAWNLYLLEVKKYKNASCDADSKTRPLVK
ncbi:pre-mRNA-splicing factor 38B [Wyeomyia smithii]|uniref:pre-mRNA-splicing factor 38B n=1 Tax=Wyeomyia smithii TaxID=174621 RepID=UPI002467F5FE|nr:pre-mRNA-splicing factor 38B [Wyeomyia smithii]